MPLAPLLGLGLADVLDYWVAYQAGYLLRLLELPPSERFDFVGTGSASARVEELLTAGLKLTDAEQSAAPRFAEAAAHWAMMNLRSFAIGMRIDQRLADRHRHPDLEQPTSIPWSDEFSDEDEMIEFVVAASEMLEELPARPQPN